jgi:amino acid adenylation domain-containing protein
MGAMSEMTASKVFSLSPEQQAALAAQPSAGLPSVMWMDTGTRVDEARLRSAVERVLCTHEVLRHAFVSIDGYAGLRQQVLDTMPPIDWQTVNMSATTEVAQDREFADWLRAFADAPLEIDRALLVRAAVVRVGEGRCILALAVSALVADRGSLQNLFTQLSHAYADGAAWEPRQPFQYARFVEWREVLAASHEAAEGQAYWTRYLDGCATLPKLQLSYRLREVRMPSHQRLSCARPMDPSLTARVAVAADVMGTAPDVLLQAAWWLLLARLQGFGRFVGGWLHDCRRNYEVMQCSVGVYQKVLPLVVDLQAGEEFSTWMQRLDAVLDAHADAQEYWAVEAPPLSAQLAVGFSVSDVPDSGTSWRLREVCDVGHRFELSMQVVWDGAGAGSQFVLHADGDCYAQPAIECLLQQFATLVEHIVEAPSARLDDLSLIGPQEREALLAASTRQADFGRLTIAQHVVRWAEATPDAIAIVAGERRMSYRQLADDANRMAHWLVSQGVGRGDLVALSLPRSAELLVAMLAVWQAGGAYLPLEPEWPEARRHAVLADAGPVLVLLADAGALNQELPCRAVALDGMNLNVFDASAPGVAASFSDVAYVLYTSGSTGQPKGAVIEHGALLNYVAAVSSELQLGDCRRWALTSSVAADLGNTALFGALFNGAALVVASADDMQDAQAFSRFMAAHDIDALKIVPSHLEALLECERPRLPLTLVLGGEAAPRALVERILRLAPGCAIYNHYGPTEAAVGVMVHARGTGADFDEVMPLSSVLANNRVLVLDEAHRLVPPGALGHVYIGGVQLCRGYLKREVEGAFVPDPFHPGERLYCTGDLAYGRPEGGLLLAGRADHQVKIRGFRVEPAEVEAALLSCPGVRQAVVVALNEKDGIGKSLVGCVLADPKERQVWDDRELRGLLSTRLPAHMVPARLVSLPAFPRLANGKVDRLALVELSAVPEERATPAGTPPRNVLEATLASCMAELLGRPSIGVDEDFFELGGHSLLAIKFAARMRRQLQVEVAPGLVFDFPTVAQLAEALDPLLLEQQEVLS